MSRTAFFKLYTANFLDGTRFMTQGEVGDYIRLLVLIYDQGGKVENDPHLLRHLLRCTKAPDAAKRIQRLVDLNKLSTDSCGYLHNGRADREIEKLNEGCNEGSNRGSNNPSGTPKKATNSTRARAQTRRKMNTYTDVYVNAREARSKNKPKKNPMIEAIDRMRAALRDQEDANGSDHLLLPPTGHY
jgi:uncharacterized protein YdaU (DUF1376 family)